MYEESDNEIHLIEEFAPDKVTVIAYETPPYEEIDLYTLSYNELELYTLYEILFLLNEYE